MKSPQYGSDGQQKITGKGLKKETVLSLSKSKSFLPEITNKKSSTKLFSVHEPTKELRLSKKLQTHEELRNERKQTKKKTFSEYQKGVNDKVKRIGKLSPIKAIKIEIENQPILQPNVLQSHGTKEQHESQNQIFEQGNYIINVKEVSSKRDLSFNGQKIQGLVQPEEERKEDNENCYTIVVRTVEEKEAHQVQIDSPKAAQALMSITNQRREKKKSNKLSRSFQLKNKAKNTTNLHKVQPISSSLFLTPIGKNKDLQDKVNSTRSIATPNKQNSSSHSSRRIQMTNPHKIFKSHPFLDALRKKERKSHVVSKRQEKTGLKKISTNKINFNQNPIHKLERKLKEQQKG